MSSSSLGDGSGDKAKCPEKVGIVGKYGTCYGASLQKMVKKIEINQHTKYTCSFCGKTKRKRHDEPSASGTVVPARKQWPPGPEPTTPPLQHYGDELNLGVFLFVLHGIVYLDIRVNVWRKTTHHTLFGEKSSYLFSLLLGTAAHRPPLLLLLVLPLL